MKKTILFALIITFVFFFYTNSASALTYYVTKTADDNGTCDSDDCSLREAVIAANNNIGADTIRFAVDGTFVLSISTGYSGEIEATDERDAYNDLDITDTAALSIIGNGPNRTIIDGYDHDRVFQSKIDNLSLSLSYLTLQNGSDFFEDSEVGYENGATIYYAGRKLLINKVVIQNVGENARYGSAIYTVSYDGVNMPELYILNSQVINNITNGSYSVIHSNGKIILLNSTVANNTAEKDLIYIGDSAGDSQSLISKSTIADNYVDNMICGSENGIINNYGNLSIINSTVAKNGYTEICDDNIIGIIRNNNNLSIGNSTIVNNSIEFYYVDPIAGGISGNTTIKNSIVSNNIISIFEGESWLQNCSDPLTSFDYNIINDDTCGLDAEHDVYSMPLFNIRGLANFGGPTKTYAITKDSLRAYNTIPADHCTDFLGNALTTDQRNFARPVGDYCDIGAYEIQ